MKNEFPEGHRNQSKAAIQSGFVVRSALSAGENAPVTLDTVLTAISKTFTDPSTNFYVAQDVVGLTTKSITDVLNLIQKCRS